MQLKSPEFSDQQMIPIKYTCKGNNISPPLHITDVPEGTVSLTLILHDPDAPGGDFVHWLVWNIPPEVTEIAEGQVPTHASQGMTSFGKPTYGGPCPPSGTHRYIFTLTALDSILDLPLATDRYKLLSAMKPHTIETATLTGLFGEK